MFTCMLHVFPPIFEILNRQELCVKSVTVLNHRTILGFYFGENCGLLASSLVSLEAEMFPSVWLSVIFASSLLEGAIAPLFSTHSQTHTHIHTHSHRPPFLGGFLHYLPFHCLFFLTLPVQAVCVNGTLLCFVVDPLQAQLCLTRVASSFNRYRQGPSLCLWISATHTLYLYFLYSLLLSTHPHLWIPLFPPFLIFSPLHQTLIFLFSLPSFLCFDPFFGSTLLVSFCFLSWHTRRGQYNPFSKVFTAHPARYYRFIHPYRMSCGGCELFRVYFSL